MKELILIRHNIRVSNSTEKKSKSRAARPER